MHRSAIQQILEKQQWKAKKILVLKLMTANYFNHHYSDDVSMTASSVDFPFP